ncbi:protease modulator HflK [Luteolibacter soli]|uniref:Protease modulator HflK n=1 Tax=Luteolibacter soli TaxID=3135280 RepID=A0ABU9AXI1_9BACT
MKKHSLRSEGRAVEALLILLKHLTAHARWVFAILLLLYALSGIRTIQPQEQALLLRFGRLQPQVHGPGLLVGLPEPFDKVLRFETGKDLALPLDRWKMDSAKIQDPDKAVQFTDAQMAEKMKTTAVGGAVYSEYDDVKGRSLDPVTRGYSLSSDFNVVQGSFVLRYRIAEPFRYASAGEGIGTLLEKLGYRAITRQLADRKIDASLTSDRRDLASAAAREVQDEATRLQLGVVISGIDIRELSPPSQVLAAFEDVTNAKQFAKTLFENARQYESTTLSQSEGEAASIRHRAEGHASGLLADAEGESSAFTALLVNYRQQPELVSGRLLQETLDTVMGRIRSRTLLPADQARPSLILEPSPEYGH